MSSGGVARVGLGYITRVLNYETNYIFASVLIPCTNFRSCMCACMFGEGDFVRENVVRAKNENDVDGSKHCCHGRHMNSNVSIDSTGNQQPL